MTVEELRAEWSALRDSLNRHITYLEAGGKIYPVCQDADSATVAFLAKLKQYRTDVEGWLATLPGS
jgi:hypothetical protein